MRWIKFCGTMLATMSMASMAQAGLFGHGGGCGSVKSCGCASTCQPACCKPVIVKPCCPNVYTYQRRLSDIKPPCCDTCAPATCCAPAALAPACAAPAACAPAPAACAPACAAPAACAPAPAACAPACAAPAPAVCAPAAAPACAAPAPAVCAPACAAPAACAPACAAPAPTSCATGCGYSNSRHGGLFANLRQKKHGWFRHGGTNCASTCAPVANSCAAPAACAPTCAAPAQCCNADPCEIAQLIYVSQTACYAKDRRRAIHRLGDRYDCVCNPEIMHAFIYALNDTDERVREKAADEIGDQLRRHCCCTPEVVAGLTHALGDCDRGVVRQSKQALELCGYEVVNGDCGPSCTASCAPAGCVNGGFAPGVQSAPAPAPEQIPAPVPPAARKSSNLGQLLGLR